MSEKLREQIAAHAYRGGKPKPGDTIYYSAEENPYTTDDMVEEDDRFYAVRQPSSVVRRGKIPLSAVQNRTTIMRVTRHVGPHVTPRASLQDQQPQQQAKQKPFPQQRQKRLHWLFYVGCGAMASLALWIAGSTALSWLQVQHDNSVYGYPRTYQIDVNVGHQGVSHFTVENLNGDILVMELHPSDLAETHLYQGPLFSGPGADDYVATISFKDVNGDGKPDMIIAVNNQRYVLMNDGTGFRPSTPSDHINQEVN